MIYALSDFLITKERQHFRPEGERHERQAPHRLEIDEAANERMDALMPQLMKASDQRKWVGLANACRAQAEEFILTEVVFE